MPRPVRFALASLLAVGSAWADSGAPDYASSRRSDSTVIMQSGIGAAVERQLPPDAPFTEWRQPEPSGEAEPAGQVQRVKVCRVETVCKLRYQDGQVRRARIRNLVSPLRFTDSSTGVSQKFQDSVQRAVNSLRDKGNVVVKFIGFTDDGALTGADARIYGTPEVFSRAVAEKVAAALRKVLPGTTIEADGRGAASPITSNDTSSGRALNRRVEVEFWYDDPLEDLPDEPQLCPAAPAPQAVTRVYDPASGPIAPIALNHGRPEIADDYLARLRQALEEVQDKTRPRLRFIGYTADERLDRRTAMAYGDDIGLSVARARRAADAVKAALALTDDQIEFEGRGYVQSADVVSDGFTESDNSRVDVQIVYDETMAPAEGRLDATPVTREVTPANPFALNLMRIAVDGKPIDDRDKGNEDIQRCTDVALEHADILFKFDNLELKPRLNVTAWPNAVRYRDDPETEVPDNLVRFKAYSNYWSFIAHAEVRIFERDQSTRDHPLAVLDVGSDGTAEWQASFDSYEAPGRELQYVLRVYDAGGLFDETAPQALWLIDRVGVETQTRGSDREMQVGYGENRLAVENIPLKGGTIEVHGNAIPPGHTVSVGGEPVPVAGQGDFVAEKILPEGLHSVEVGVLDQSGNGDLFLRDLELKKSDWFYVGIADVTASKSDTSGPAELVTNDQAHYDNDVDVDGRLAGYVRGKFGDNWQLTASADTLEGPIDDLFSNFTDKSPDALFRRIDPDKFYPTYGDDGTVEEGAPTLGKLYAKLQRDEDYGLWGNFKVGYFESYLANVDRTLYGANLHYQSTDTTSFGEERLFADGFAAEPGTVASRDEFRGTDGSLYYLRHQDILTGSERVRVEVRDKDSGMVTAVKNLVSNLDYSVDYLQGRIVLAEPLPATSNDDLLVESGAGNGNEVYLVVRYEYTPGFGDLNSLANGGRVHYWIGDSVRLGMTASHSKDEGDSGDLDGLDVLVRKSAQSWLRIEGSQSKGPGVTTLQSADGGFSFADASALDVTNTAHAHRIDASVGLADVYDGGKGTTTLYKQFTEAGYSAPGLAAAKDTDQYGGSVATPLTDNVGLRAKADRRIQTQGLETVAGEADIDYRLDDNWTLSTGARNDYRKDRSPVVPLTQIEGERTDAVARATYDSNTRWLAYGYAQDTVRKTGNQDGNGRVGAGGGYRATDRLRLTGEASTGDLGEGGRLGTDYLYSDRTTVYTNYALENERTDNGVRARKGNLVSGFRSRYSDSASVYLEDRYTHGDVPTGLTHATGIDLAPTDRWSLGVDADYAELRDQQTSAETRRRALGGRVGYGFEALKMSSALEYRIDDAEAIDLSRSKRTTWLIKNSLKYQLTPSSRIIGKLDHSESNSSLGEFYDGRYTEAVAGYGYRPIDNDRLNLLLKYVYFYNLPSAGQVTLQNTAAEFIQKSHIFSLDTLYDLTDQWTVGAKYAYRLGQLSEDRVDPEFFDSRAHLYIARLDWHFVQRWDSLVEGRLLDLPDAQDRRKGVLVALYRQLGENVKLGAGYNFADFSDDLTDLNYDHQGVFVNLVGTI